MKRIDFLKNKYKNIHINDFKKLVNADPTKEKKYLDWLCNLYKKGDFKLNELEKVNYLLNIFNDLKYKLINKDIGAYSSPFDLSIVLNEFMLKNKISEEECLKKGFKKIYEDNKWIIVKPFTKEASIQYGKNTKWCTSAIDKNTPEKNEFKKMQLFLGTQEYEYEFKNSLNNNINVVKFFKKHKELLNFFMKIENFESSLCGSLIFLIKDPSEEQQFKAVCAEAFNIKYIKKPTANVQEYVVRHNYKTFYYIKKPCSNAQLEFIQNIEVHGSAIKKIYEKGIEPNEKVKLIAVRKYPEAIKHIPNPSINVQVEAVERCANMIKYIKNPTEKVQLIAVKQNGNLINYIKNPTKEIKIYAIANKINLAKKFTLTKDMILKIAELNSGILSHTNFKISKEEQIKLVSINPNVIINLKKPCNEVQIKAIKKDYNIIKFIKNPTKSAEKLSKKIEEINKKLYETKVQDDLNLYFSFKDLDYYNYMIKDFYK